MNWDDGDCDVLYYSNSLWNHSEETGRDLVRATEGGAIFHLGLFTKNIWARDYMPIQVGGHYVKFSYKGYGGQNAYKKYPWLKVSPAVWWDLSPVVNCPVVLDGGNIVRGGDQAIVTDIVYRHNPRLRKDAVRAKIERALDAEVVVIPHEPYDSLGHSDGIVKYIDNHHIFVNDSPTYNANRRAYVDKLHNVLRDHGLTPVPMPCLWDDRPRMTEREFRKEHPLADDWNPGWGYYINALRIKGLVLVPVMGVDADDDVLRRYEDAYPGHKVCPIRCSRLSMEGGLVNCCCMSYKS